MTILEGAYAGGTERPHPREPEPLVVFAGRHIPEKGVPALVPALANARESIPGLRGLILGDGPERQAVLDAVADADLEEAVDVPGFVAPEEVDDAIRRALCMVLPSRREGYGMVVVEASARGTPSVVAAGPDNAAVELVDEGINGRIASSAAPEDLARAIVRVARDGMALRESTCEWFERNAQRLSLGPSLERVVREYRALYARP